MKGKLIMNKLKFKNILHITISLSFALCFLFAAQITIYASNAYVLYEKTAIYPISKDTNYKTYQQVTDAGLRDIFVVSIPVKDPNIVISSVESAEEYGKKATTSDMLSSAGAIAGVNGDFFGMTGSYSAPFGPVVRDGTIISINERLNAEKNEFASFYIDENNNPFILYLKPSIQFFNNGTVNIDVATINKITDMRVNTYIDASAFENTASLDDRFDDLVKIMVKDNVITYISGVGETLDVPELGTGYLIVVPKDPWEEVKEKFGVGDTTSVVINSTGIDFNKIEQSIGGATKFLTNGEVTIENDSVASGRQPRTAVGISGDGTRIILMVVDGRSHSIGATTEEMAYLMLREGASNAMHLDGGGSTTMAVQTLYDDELSVVNTTSDGAERKVMNALGVFNKSEVQEVKSLEIIPETEATFIGTPVTFKAFTLDEYFNRTPMSVEELHFSVNDVNGVWEDGLFYPSTTGKLTFYASNENLQAKSTVNVMNLSNIESAHSHIYGTVGKGTPIQLLGKSIDGYAGPLHHSAITYEVVPNEIGYVENGEFIGTQIGSGYIKCSFGDVNTHIGVTTMYHSIVISEFNANPINSVILQDTYPNDVPGSVSLVSNAPGERTAIKLSYDFDTRDVTQASYVVFDPPLALNGEVISLKSTVYGDNSNTWLRGKLLDGNGEIIYIDFAKEVDFEGYKDLEATLPSGTVYPVTLERIYIVSSANTPPINGTIYIDNLLTTVKVNSEKVTIPTSTPYNDYMVADLTTTGDVNTFDVVIAPSTLFPGYKLEEDINPPYDYSTIKTNIVNKMSRNSFLEIFAGETDISLDKMVTWSSDYRIDKYNENLAVVQMYAGNGGFIKSNASQWNKFQFDIAESECQHVLIIMDKNPFNFNYDEEFELFHDVLHDFKEQGKTVTVVSTDGTSTKIVPREGVRYINLGDLYKSDLTTNDGSKLLRIRYSETEMKYQLENIL